MPDHTPLTDQQLNEIDAHVNGPLGAATVFDQQTVTLLVAEVRRLQEQRKYLIGQLAKRDAETGDAERALREFLTAHPGEDEMAASMVRDGFGPDEVVDILRRPIAPVVGEPSAEACGKCKRPFDPADPSFDGRAQYAATPYCRGCVDRCHDNNSADHRCVICG